MKFDIHGPFRLERNENGLVDPTAAERREYWERVDSDVSGLSNGCGCYVFTINAGRGRLPWYVGKAERQSFKQECFSPHKIDHYSNPIGKRKGMPELFFLPQLTRKGKFRKPTKGNNGRKAIVALESLLIGTAYARNPNLLNIKGVKMYRELEVAGFLNSNAKKNALGAKLFRQSMRK